MINTPLPEEIIVGYCAFQQREKRDAMYKVGHVSYLSLSGQAY